MLTPRHTSEKNRAKTIDLVHSLHTYLHFHIKALKANLHMRMRAKTYEFVKIINRAQPMAETNAKCVVDVKSRDLERKLSRSQRYLPTFYFVSR